MTTQTFEAVIDENGNAHFPDAVRLPQGMKVLVMIPEQVSDYDDIIAALPSPFGKDKRVPAFRRVPNELLRSEVDPTDATI